MSYTGKYMCSEGFAGPEAEAELAVVDPLPLCLANASATENTLVENDYLWMMCNASFSGSLNLRMYWTKTSTGSVIHNTSNSRNQSMIVIKVNWSDNGETFTFKAIFRQENNSHETVVTWNFTVKVFYTPRNLVIKPDGGVYEVGDRLECWADGNPTPNYEWMDTETRRTITGSVLVLEEDLKPGQNHTFRCTAYNTVAGLRDDVHSDHVTFRVAVTSKCQEEVLGERQEKTISKEHSQHHNVMPADEGLGNEGNYANLMHKSFEDQRYSRLHVCANSSVGAGANTGAGASAECANMPLN